MSGNKKPQALLKETLNLYIEPCWNSIGISFYLNFEIKTDMPVFVMTQFQKNLKKNRPEKQSESFSIAKNEDWTQTLHAIAPRLLEIEFVLFRIINCVIVFLAHENNITNINYGFFISFYLN